ncbi:biopolymer transporter ExbD [Flavobacterium sp. ZT3R18]|uniref:ExbD/TolR family protein n=1 Tax=Flavobacterium sp. ZT3R18 TaxID=2594429 RepID=UPI00117A433C|nr:biopolymer transporter ExbD [Flavobacterium sp. ZT3R18]TRX35801.1 biopolymer transporter ExbD [Flavobacterium sp. ZT3R18]
MSEFRNEFGRKTGKIRSKKLNSSVDLTAMISVSFLLIIFFMLNNELARPQTMSLTMPEDNSCGRWGGCYGEDRSLTLLLGDNDKVVLYKGVLMYPIIKPKVVRYGKHGIRKELLEINKLTLEYSAAIGRPNSGLIVIIKPSKNSNFRNLVDILDEMSIVGVNTYAIVNAFTPEEVKLIAK